MYKTRCVVCKNQEIPVLILRQPLPRDGGEAFKTIDKMTSFVTLVNQIVGLETHHFQFEVKQESNISIVFLSAGSCTQIRDIKISYYVCERNSSNGIYLPETIAPSGGFQRVNLSCPENTLSPGNEAAYGLCSSKGIWTIVHGSPCMCKEGFTLNIFSKACQSKLFLLLIHLKLLTCIIRYLFFVNKFLTQHVMSGYTQQASLPN